MQHLLTPASLVIPSFAWMNNVFSENELDFLQKQAKQSTDRGNTANINNVSELQSIRRSNVSWINKNNETSWIYEKLSGAVSSLNAKHFRFDLTGFGEPLQLTNYDQSEHGMYVWHQDYNEQYVSRKLSLVVQLSDPSEYEGGNLQIATGPEPTTVRKERGLIVAFPSYVLHQVTPVTNGSRQSLVVWISGPPFK